MSDCIDPSLISYADQRIQSTAVFLDRMIVSEASMLGEAGSDDSLAVCALSAALDRIITHRSALTDALSLAIRRLAVEKPTKLRVEKP